MTAANNPTAANATGVYTLSMPHSLPSYLIALTVAKYEFRPLGDRSGVYAEPNLIDDTAEEMAFLPDMLAAAERILGAYPFERYDLVFPPKYTGGMENPELNFIGQDFVTGNHPAPLVPNGVMAHELSHAWFGDVTTCAEWNDLWLNEGFATYYTTRIEEEMGRAEQARFELFEGRDALDQFFATRPAPRLTVLHRTFIGSERPVFTNITYQKGEALLETLDDRMGRAAYDAAIVQYLRRHPYHWVDDVDFKAALPDVPSLQLDDWLYGTGLPSNVSPKPSSAIAARLIAAANAFRNGTRASGLDTAGWTPDEQGYFLLLIADITVPRMGELDAVFHLSEMNTPPLSWLVAEAKALDATSRSVLDRYLARGTAVSLPVWSTLAQTTAGRAYAVGVFGRVRGLYDAASEKSIAFLLQL